MATASSRRLAICLAVFALISNASTIYEIQHIPRDPYHFAQHLSLYSYFACALCVVGIVGAVWDIALLVNIFSKYLLLDTFVSALPRLLAITLFPAISDSFCSQEIFDTWRRPGGGESLEAPRQNGNGTGAARLEDVNAFLGQQDCRTIFSVLQALFVLAVLGATVAQLILAIKVRAHACALSRRPRPRCQSLTFGSVCKCGAGDPDASAALLDADTDAESQAGAACSRHEYLPDGKGPLREKGDC